MKYVIRHVNLGYLCDDEDRCGGFGYDPEIDEYTVRFNTYEEAAFQCEKDEVVEEIEA